MPDLTDRVLSHLEDIGFNVRSGWTELFGERVPLLTGMAWELQCAQLALVAEDEGPIDATAWRQLLFAGSGIRHQLAGDEASAFGTPVILAIVDHEASAQLRLLVENLAKEYAVFNRVDLNIVPQGAVGSPKRLDDALAPLLPRCRRLCGSEISKREVQQFWNLLRSEVEAAADGLDDIFGDRRARAGREGANALIGDSPHAPELPSPSPIEEIRLRRFRSIESLDMQLSDVNVIAGTNGGGKTSLIEAMELTWAGVSQRKPVDVSVEEYSAHLPLDGEGGFSIEASGRLTERPSSEPHAELGRCVLTQEAMAALASEPPRQRFSTLLTLTGLEIPDVKARTEALVRECKSELDRSLSAAGMANLERIDRVGLKHLHEEVRSDFAGRYARLPELGPLEEAVTGISKGAFDRRHWKAEAGMLESLEAADRAVSAASDGRRSSSLQSELDIAREMVAALLDERVQASAAVRRLLEALRAQLRSEHANARPSEDDDSLDRAPPPVGVELASRWLRHADGLKQSASSFKRDAADLDDEDWADQLSSYASALDQAASLAPAAVLKKLSAPAAPPVPRTEVKASPEVQRAAGFSDAAIDAATVGPVLRELGDALDTHVAALRDIGRQLETHPSRHLDEHWETLMDSLCRFELARTLRREGPIQQASERMVSELLDERLAPVVAELMASIVRFEWYFRPLKMSTKKRQVVLGGLATERADLDARLLLNSAEKSVLGLAWFLALHILQPRERRAVLVLDDPTAAFDTANTAGFTSTLRALIRLLKPQQVLIATHDDRVAALLCEELRPVDGWPSQIRRTRFQRNANLRSEAIEEWSSELQCHTQAELERIGLFEGSAPGPMPK